VIKSIKPFKLVDRKPAKTNFNKAKTFSVAQNDFPNLPSKIKPPTIDELKLMQTKLDRLKVPLPKVYAAYYGEDWKTQGDWVGRTTRDYFVQCANWGPSDGGHAHSADYFNIGKFMGPHHRKDDAVRMWVHWQKTSNPRSLYNPWIGYRRQSEWDDHGETYPMTQDGPDVWYILEVKHKGVFRVDMYFFNKDGHGGANRFRDYVIEVYPTKEVWYDYSRYGYPKTITENSPSIDEKMRTILARRYEWVKLAKIAEQGVRTSRPLCKTRVRDFWGGVHKQIVVTGPAHYLVKIDRNYSFNTIISSVGIDRIHGEPTKDEIRGIPDLAGFPYNPPKFPNKYSTEIGTEVYRLWNLLDAVYAKSNNFQLQWRYRVQAYHAASRLNTENNRRYPRLERCIAWRLNQWNEEQRKEWQDAMKQGHEKLLEKIPRLREILEKAEKPETPEEREKNKRYWDSFER
ncbi:MAG: hypothetical protein LBC74_05995, partial [Planctomycetaceae bacterium]|nr:hypothetical protein [Planctomycetaceae bacterium]